MIEILELFKLVEPVGIVILIWRSLVADRESPKLLDQIERQQIWVEGLVTELLSKTEAHGRVGGSTIN